MALQPHDLDASDMIVTSKSGDLSPPLTSLQCYSTMHNVGFTTMSERADVLCQMNRSRYLVVMDRSINLLKKEQPALTVIHAWLSLPIKDSSSFFLHAFRPRHDAKALKLSQLFVWETNFLFDSQGASCGCWSLILHYPLEGIHHCCE